MTQNGGKTTNWQLARHDQCRGFRDRLRIWVLGVHERHCRPGRLDDLSVIVLDPYTGLACLCPETEIRSDEFGMNGTPCNSHPSHRLPFACSRESRMLDEPTDLSHMFHPREKGSPERTSWHK